jgi:hypothetical protein
MGLVVGPGGFGVRCHLSGGQRKMSQPMNVDNQCPLSIVEVVLEVPEGVKLGTHGLGDVSDTESGPASLT